jgi:hypothetical protein
MVGYRSLGEKKKKRPDWYEVKDISAETTDSDYILEKRKQHLKEIV